MAEQIEEQQQEEVVSAGDGGKGKSGEQIAADNRLNLYNQILNLKEPGFSDVYKKAGFKKFDALLKDNQDFQGELLNDLIDRGFKIDPENFSAAYTNIKPVNVYNMPQETAPAPPPVPKDTEDDGIFSQLKGMAKNFYDVTKTAVQNPLTALKFLNPFSDLNPLNVVRKEQSESLGKYAKRGYYTGVAGQGAQAEDFARGKVDTKNLAKYLKKAHELGATQLEAEFAKDEGFLKDSQDMALILVPSILESFANMFGAGYKKIIGATAAGAGAGAAYGSVVPGAGTAAGALTGGSRALQYSMLQQGYNLEFVGTIIDELTQKKLINMDADEQTLEKQLKDAFANKELMAPIFKKANTRAAAITGVDWAFGGMGNATMRTLAKSKVLGKALQTPAGRVIAQVAEATVSNPVYKRAAILANRVAQIDRKIGKSAVGRAGAAMGVADMMGGAVGEGLAQSLTQENLDWKALTVEGLAEGKFINTLRALGDIGDKRNVEAAARNIAEGKPADDGDVEFVAVTDEEYNNYKKGKVDPERAAGIRDDLDIALGNANHLNKLEAADPLYGKMVKDAYDKVIRAFENQKLYNLAINEIADLHGMTEQETRDSITPSSPGFNQKISDDFKNTLSVLQQQYKQETGDDSKDTTGVSGEVGGGTKSQQAESEQRASEEEAGNDRVVQEAADQQRLKEIDDLLSDDDDFFNQSGDRLLSPEERQDLEQEKESIANKTVAPAGGAVAAGATTATAPAETVTQPTQPVAPTEEQIADDLKNKRFATFTYASEDEVPEQFKDRISSRGETNGVPFVRVTLPQSVADFEVAKAAATPATETAPAAEGETTTTTAAETTTTTPATETTAVAETTTSTAEQPTKKRGKKAATTAEAAPPAAQTTPAPKEIKPSDVEVRKGKTHEQDGLYEAVYKGKVIGKFSFDKKERMWVDASGDKFAQKKDVIGKFVLQYNMKAEAAAETTTTKGEGKGKAAPTGKAESAPTAEGETKSKGKNKIKQAASKIAEAFTKRFGIKINLVGADEFRNLIINEEKARDFFFRVIDSIDVFDTDNIQEAKNFITNIFQTVESAEDAKKAYRKLAIKYHPDKRGSEEVMKHLNDVNDRYQKGTLGRGATQQARPSQATKEQRYKEWAERMSRQYEAEARAAAQASQMTDEQRAKEAAKAQAEKQQKEAGAKTTQPPPQQGKQTQQKPPQQESKIKKGIIDSLIEFIKNPFGTEKTTKGEVLTFETRSKYKQDAWNKRNKFKEDYRKKELSRINENLKNYTSNRITTAQYRQNEAAIRDEYRSLNKAVDDWYNATVAAIDKAYDKKIPFTYKQIIGDKLAGAYDPATGQAYVVLENLEDTTFIHEAFSHPFIEAVKERNKKLYDNLLKESKKEKQIVDYVDEKYNTSTQEVRDAEYIARAIDLDAKNKLNNKTLSDYIKEFWAEANKIFKDIFGGKAAAIENIGPKTKISDIVDFVLTSNVGLDLSPQTGAKTETTTETKGETKPTGKTESKPQTPKTNPFAETVRKGMEALMGAIGSKVKMNFLSPEEAAKIAAMPEKKRGKLLFQTEERNGETIPIQVAVGYRGIRGEYRADYNGIQYFAVNERYAKVFGNNIIKASISTNKILDLDKYNKLLEEKGLKKFGNEGFFTIDYSIFDEDGNFSADSMLGSMGRAKAQIGLKEFNKIYDQFVKDFNNADVIYGEDIGNPGEKVYAVKNPDAINTNNVDAAAPEGVQYMKTPDGKILGFVQKLPDGSYNVYINPETQDAETPVHEIAGHIFLPLIKKSNPELYNQGTALIQNSDYMGKANGDIAEALAIAVGDKGKLLAEKPRKGFMEWLKGMWEWVGDKLRLNPDKIKNLTLGQFTDLIAGSVLKGKELAGTKPTETAEAKPTPTAAPAKVPSFSEFDAISADRGKMKEAKAEFIAKHGQLAYDAMKEISANFTKITKALQEKEILTKKC